MNEDLKKLSAAMLKKVNSLEARIAKVENENSMLREGIKSLAQCQKNYGDIQGNKK